MKKVIGIILIVMGLCFSGPVRAEAKDKDEEGAREFFDFDEEGRVRTKDGKAERTYNFPPLKTGFIVDLAPATRDGMFYISLQLLSWEMFGEGFAIDAGVASGRVFISYDWEAIAIMKIGPSIWAGYNIPENSLSYGVGFTVLKF